MDTSSTRVDALAQVMQARGLARMRIEEGDCSIEMERPEAFPAGVAVAQAPRTAAAAATPAAAEAAAGASAAVATDGGRSFSPAEGDATGPAQAPSAEDAPAASADGAADAGERPLDMTKAVAVKAPMVGVYYAAPAPGAEPFVHVGSKVKKGDTLCVIEAMKAMNEVTAEVDGEVVDVCASDGELVEYGCVLMKLY
ncbi:acetyl-CoA carboxylase biotin carboxyl carrier protein [Parafannyhessea umbonata]|uniref:Biotin carboxyl carrier protein of acetyl-CoA carboxylase n=1 Tax=Parafannyhessea umbonata TaxID=604330 RepID=A0A1G6I8H7_9ACTN|nr:biotin/lipoyl-containing protein [Parafannyhessea umbonata]SDC02325.1 Biotin-requiring enzyme [Parafannyhessea umbonata]